VFKYIFSMPTAEKTKKIGDKKRDKIWKQFYNKACWCIKWRRDEGYLDCIIECPETMNEANFKKVFTDKGYKIKRCCMDEHFRVSWEDV
jgi:hypothetical protein